MYIVWSAAIRFTSNAPFPSFFPSSIVCVPVAIRRAVGIHARLGSHCVRANNKIIHQRAERKKTYNNKRLPPPEKEKRISNSKKDSSWAGCWPLLIMTRERVSFFLVQVRYLCYTHTHTQQLDEMFLFTYSTLACPFSSFWDLSSIN
jgi:hypothetical protein